MAVPKGKTSKSKKKLRRTQSFKISMPNLVTCSKCGELMQSHRVCKSCGSYNKQTVLNVE